jgi:hypothetical protein
VATLPLFDDHPVLAHLYKDLAAVIRRVVREDPRIGDIGIGGGSDLTVSALEQFLHSRRIHHAAQVPVRDTTKRAA